MFDVNSLSPSDLAQLKAMLGGITDTSGRTPEVLGPLHDLNQLPAADNPRPLFVWSAESPKRTPVGRPTEHPKLMWHKDRKNSEITVKSRDEEDAKAKLGYVTVNPHTEHLSPVDRAAAEFAALTPEDQALVLETQRQARLARVSRTLEGLTDAEVNTATTVTQVRKRA